MNNFFEYFCIPIFILLLLILITLSLYCSFIESFNNKKTEIIKHSEDFIVYNECFEINNKYYCRIEN